MTSVLVGLAWLLQLAAPATDPHNGEYTRGLGVACAYCHSNDDWAHSPLPAFATARQMEEMTTAIADGSLKGRGAVTCYTCHRGAIVPRPMSDDAWRPMFDDWPATAITSPRESGKPARDRYRNLQVLGSLNADQIRVAMSAIAASLGVNCEYCHAGDEWDSDNKPAKKTAREMLRMVADLTRAFPAAATPMPGCYVCHQGETEPAR